MGQTLLLLSVALLSFLLTPDSLPFVAAAAAAAAVAVAAADCKPDSDSSLPDSFPVAAAVDPFQAALAAAAVDPVADVPVVVAVQPGRGSRSCSCWSAAAGSTRHSCP